MYHLIHINPCHLPTGSKELRSDLDLSMIPEVSHWCFSLVVPVLWGLMLCRVRYESGNLACCPQPPRSERNNTRCNIYIKILYNTIIFLLNPNKRHNIACPWGLLWFQNVKLLHMKMQHFALEDATPLYSVSVSNKTMPVYIQGVQRTTTPLSP